MFQRQNLNERCKNNVPGRAANKSSNEIQDVKDNNEDHGGCSSVKNSPVPSPDVRMPEKLNCPMVELMKGRLEAGDNIAPPYFPQPDDGLMVEKEGPMGPIGPWATGCVTYSPFAGITGLRPVVDRYSSTRYSPAEWRAHNRIFFDESNEMIREAELTIADAKRCKERVYKESDKNQLENRDRLSTRAGEVHRWKTELEQTLLDITHEIELLEGERRRVQQSLSVLTLPELIAGEFLQLRSTRLEPDLVRDDVEIELVKEVALCAEIRNLFERTREQIVEQLLELKSVKNRMECDWTDKKDAYEIDAFCVGLNNSSPLILFKPGATRVPAEQTTPDGYDHFTKEALAAAETAKQRSIKLRSTLDAIYTNSLKDLRTQSNRVNSALAEKITLTEQVCESLEKELLRCLYELTNLENMIEDLRGSTRSLNDALKVAQTRLGNRLLRRNVENCRDEPQYGLIEEAKTLGESISALMSQLRRAENAQAGLVKARNDLEKEITVKRKSLNVDRDRGLVLRSFYPSAAALLGQDK